MKSTVEVGTPVTKEQIEYIKKSILVPEAKWEELQAENTRLLQAVADGGIKAGELTAKVIDRERRLGEARLTLAWYADRQNYDHEGRIITNGDAPRWQIHVCDFGAKARATLADCNLDSKIKEE